MKEEFFSYMQCGVHNLHTLIVFRTFIVFVAKKFLLFNQTYSVQLLKNKPFKNFEEQYCRQTRFVTRLRDKSFFFCHQTLFFCIVEKKEEGRRKINEE